MSPKRPSRSGLLWGALWTLSLLAAFGESITLDKSLTLFDPTHPGVILNTLPPRTEIEAGEPNANGWVPVVYSTPDGNIINALCRASDLNIPVPAALPDRSLAPSRSEPQKNSLPTFGETGIYRTLRDSLIDASGESLNTGQLERLSRSQYVLVYFSAHLCQPCRKFTPVLVDFYKEQIEQPIEVVFVSRDESRSQQLEYMKEAHMAWPAVAFDRISSCELNPLAGEGIPCLVLLDAEGRVLSDSYKDREYLGPSHVLEDLMKILSTPRP